MTASSRDSAEALCRQIEAFFGGGRCFLLSKGRVGLYAGLRALGLPPGSKVLMPGYTCVVVPAAVQHAGLRPVYVDIDPDTYNLDAKRLDDAAGGGLSAVIVQHTYGIPADMEAIGAWALSRSLPVIEDCCHTFGGAREAGCAARWAASLSCPGSGTSSSRPAWEACCWWAKPLWPSGSRRSSATSCSPPGRSRTCGCGRDYDLPVARATRHGGLADRALPPAQPLGPDDRQLLARGIDRRDAEKI